MRFLSWLGNPAATDRQALRSVTSLATHLSHRPVSSAFLFKRSLKPRVLHSCPSHDSFPSPPALLDSSQPLSSSLTQREHRQSSLHLLSGLMPPGTATVLGLQDYFTGIFQPQGPQHSAAGWEWDATGAAWRAAVNNLLPSAFTQLSQNKVRSHQNCTFL